MEMKTLMHNQQIKMPTKFNYQPIIKVWTFRGSVEQSNDNYEYELAQAKEFGHSVEPICLKDCAYICADYEGKAELMAKERRAFKNAPELLDGEYVRIEGRIYATRWLNNYSSDPIRFDRIS